MPKFYSELQQASLENLASDPAAGVAGRIFRNTVDGKAKVDSGAAILSVVTETQTQTLTNKTLTSPTINTPVIDSIDGVTLTTATINTSTLNSPQLNTPTITIMNIDGQASTPANPSAGFYKVYIKDDGRAYMLNSSGLESGLGSGGGGGALRIVEGANSPVRTFENEMEVYEFEPGLSQELFLAIRVPQTYAAGSPINLRILWTCASTSNNALLNAVATLVRSEVDDITSTANQRTTTNSAITMSAANDLEPQKVVLDISSSVGQINAVAIAGGDLIKVKIKESSSTVGSVIKFIPDACEVTFT